MSDIQSATLTREEGDRLETAMRIMRGLEASGSLIGWMTGPIILEDAEGRHDLREHVWSGPNHRTGERISVVQNDARFILMSEKRETFEFLVETQFHLEQRCVLVTGDGFPGRRFQIALRSLHDQLRIPFYVLADGDPAGYLFYFTISRGTARRVSVPGPELAIAAARFLGVTTFDFERYGLDHSRTLVLRASERGELAHLRSCSWLQGNPAWQQELERMSQAGFKLEVEALRTWDEGFLSEIYLPNRLAESEDFLDLS